MEVIGYIREIGAIETHFRKTKESLSKINIKIETEDNQKLFCEIRKNNFQKVMYMRNGMRVRVTIHFAGSEKNNKMYNNLIITDIDII